MIIICGETGLGEGIREAGIGFGEGIGVGEGEGIREAGVGEGVLLSISRYV